MHSLLAHLQEFTGAKLATVSLTFCSLNAIKHIENYNRNILKITEKKLIKNLNISTRKFKQKIFP